DEIEKLSVIHGNKIQVTLPNGNNLIGYASGFGEEGELILETIPESGESSEILKIAAAHEIRLQ
ncbi:MAG: hypothetical protein HRU47_12005, partial [Verrucomicrobiales bacterium]|nr:hypothetical protein [Verrucomicrobiales bacterium]